MKKALLSIAAIVLCSQGFAQITLKDTSFNNPVGTTDSIIYAVDGFNTVASNDINSAHTNFTWDFTTMNFVSGTGAFPRWKVIPYVTATGYQYAANITDTVNHKTITGTFPALTYPAGILTNIAAGGLTEYGRKVAAQSISIGFLPGANTTDSIKILAQNSMFYQTTIGNQLTNRVKIKFPATMSTSWSNLYQDTVKGLITYSTTYNADTIQIKETVTETVDVIGWGKARVNIPMPEMATTATNSVYFNVLQVRVLYQVVDSFFVEGVAISNTILNQLGVSQGQNRLDYYYDYYRPDYVVPFIHAVHTDATRLIPFNNRHQVNPEHFNPTSVKNLMAETGFSVYPNPVQGGKVFVDIKEANATAKWSYNIININGQTIANDVLNVNGGKAEVTLPSNMASGIYYITITDGDRKMTKSLSID